MLFNPYRDKVRTVAGSRILEDPRGLIGREVRERHSPHRPWTIENVYGPLRRALGGIRVKVRDSKNFVSFINQRDLEVLLGLATGGGWCSWLEDEYVEEDHPGWFGVCADEDDLVDDLYDRELALRAESPAGLLLPGMEIFRRVHLSRGIDVQEYWILLSDADPTTGRSPDPRVQTILRRWARVEQVRVSWQRM